MITPGKLEEVKDLRSVWPNEALDFTPWLAADANISLLADAIGIEIEVKEIESKAGSFSVDIFGVEQGTGKTVVIENQLEETNHDHLGKLITYAAGKEASYCIWIVQKAHQEHRAAIEWLNQNTDIDTGFFLLEIKLYKIGNSDIAVKLEPVETPNEWSHEMKQSTRDASPLEIERKKFWSAFRDYFQMHSADYPPFRVYSPSTNAWLSIAFGCRYGFLEVWQTRKRNELKVDFYIPDSQELYEYLRQFDRELSQQIGVNLIWRNRPNINATRIAVIRSADFTQTENWTKLFQWITQMLTKFYEVLIPCLNQFQQAQTNPE